MMDRVEYGYPKKINQVFGPKGYGQVSVPNDLDSAFFDRRLQRILFFKGDMVSLCLLSIGKNHVLKQKRQTSLNTKSSRFKPQLICLETLSRLERWPPVLPVGSGFGDSVSDRSSDDRGLHDIANSSKGMWHDLITSPDDGRCDEISIIVQKIPKVRLISYLRVKEGVLRVNEDTDQNHLQLPNVVRG